jgi:hypothetical protein
VEPGDEWSHQEKFTTSNVLNRMKEEKRVESVESSSDDFMPFHHAG